MDDAIKKLEPYSAQLLSVGTRTKSIKRLRRALDAEMRSRRADLIEAQELGASGDEMADAAGVTRVRVYQIIAGTR